MSKTSFKGQKILMTGLTGQVGFPVAMAFAKENDVWGLARFGNRAIKEKLESANITCVPFDLAEPDFRQVPDNVDYILNFAVSFDADFDKAITATVEGLGRLVSHCRKAKGLFHCSTTGVYTFNHHNPIKETDPLGDNHRLIIPTYSISKIAAEGMARFLAKQWHIPTVIARLNVPYGNNGGWPSLHMEMILADQAIPVHINKPSIYHPIHEEDIIETIAKLLDVAAIPATIVNWAGNDPVSVEDWCEYIGSLVGKEVKLDYTDQTLESVIPDLTKMHGLIGRTKIGWRDGFREMIQARHPEIELKE